MEIKRLKAIFLIIILLGCCKIYATTGQVGENSPTEFTTCLFDAARNRKVPIAVYRPQEVSRQTKVIIFSHGYDGNKNEKSNQAYSYLTRFLSAKGFYVISIQHELPDDPSLAMCGDFMQTRLPNWERGVENILFTINEFKKLLPRLDWKGLTLIGHSNGGDMTMLFASEYPGLIKKAVSLDHRRMKTPRCEAPRIYTLRGCDYEADEGVIPTPEEQEKYHVTVVRLNGIKHGDMDNKGSEEQHDRIRRYVYKLLKD